MASLLLINGPPLNLPRGREPALYGTISLRKIERTQSGKAESMGHSLASFRSNTEQDFVDRIQKAAVGKVDLLALLAAHAKLTDGVSAAPGYIRR
jgi:3-dehydroquinate dehydratase